MSGYKKSHKSFKKIAQILWKLRSRLQMQNVFRSSKFEEFVPYTILPNSMAQFLSI